jgi:hypothetical protein
MEEVLENKGSVKVADFCLEAGTLIAPNRTEACSPSYGNYGNMPDLQCNKGCLAPLFNQLQYGESSVGFMG